MDIKTAMNNTVLSADKTVYCEPLEANISWNYCRKYRKEHNKMCVECRIYSLSLSNNSVKKNRR